MSGRTPPPDFYHFRPAAMRNDIFTSTYSPVPDPLATPARIFLAVSLRESRSRPRSARSLPSATASLSRAQSSDSAASCAFAQSPRSPRPYRILQSIWFPLFRLKHPFYTQRPFTSTGITPLPRSYTNLFILSFAFLHRITLLS